MKLLVFSLLLCGVWSQEEDPSEQNHVSQTEADEDVSEVYSGGDEKSSRSYPRCNGRIFMFFSDPVTWAHAQQRCLALGGNLATIHNYRENTYLKRLTQGQEAWIGLSDAQQEGFWFWISSEPLTYTNWCPGEPNNYSPQHCVQINYSDNKCWDNLSCDETRPFVCER